MRVLLTTDTVGGVWTFTRELAGELLRRGHEVGLVSFGRDAGEEQLEWARNMMSVYSRKFVYETSGVPLEWMETNDRAYEDGAEVLLKVGREFRPDVLHSSQYCFGQLPLDVPRVITAHSDVLSWAAACRPDGMDESAWLTRYREMVQRGLDCADAVVAPTRWMAEALRAYFALEAEVEVRVIYNGRSLTDTGGRWTRKMQAVSVGRLWDEAKGIVTLAEIDSPVPLLVAGEENFGGTGLPVHAAMRLLGRLNETELVSVFRRSSMYIAASIYEPFGLAPLEAALCGCALVLRDLDSLREIWGSAAVYFRDSRELEWRLRDLAGDASALEKMQRAAMQRAVRFSAARMTEGYVRLYEELLERRAAHPRLRTTGEIACNAS